jgi:hypothetical protein
VLAARPLLVLSRSQRAGSHYNKQKPKQMSLTQIALQNLAVLFDSPLHRAEVGPQFADRGRNRVHM